MKHLFLHIGCRVAMGLCVLTGFVSCELQKSADWVPSHYTREDKTMNAFEFISYTEEQNPGTFSDLLRVLELTELDTLYSNPGIRTYFAPTNAAFDDFIGATSNKTYNWKTVEDVPLDVLTKVLLTHTIYGAKYLSTSRPVTLEKTDLPVTTMNKNILYIYRLEDYRLRYVGEYTSTIQVSNFEPTNGALHIIKTLAIKDAMRFDDEF